MFDPQMELLLTIFASILAEGGGGDSPASTWADAKAALKACGEVEDELELAVELEDADELRTLMDGWLSGKAHLPEHDRGVLKRALKAFRKRLKITVLDAESSLSGGPMSSGRSSSIVGITPPERYPRPVWDELVRQKRLGDAKHGMYMLVD